MRRLLCLLGLHLLLAGLFVWVDAAPTRVEVHAQGNQIVAVVDGQPSYLDLPRPMPGAVGIVQVPEGWDPARDPEWRGWVPAPGLLDRLWLAPTLVSLQVAGEPGVPAFTADDAGALAPAGPGLVLVPGRTWTGFELDASFRARGRPVAVVVSFQDSREGYAAVVSGPREETVDWWLLTDGRLDHRLRGSPHRLPFLAAAREVARELLQSYALGVGLLLVLALVATIISRLPVPPPARLPRLPHGLAVFGLAAGSALAAGLIAVRLLEAMPHVQDAVAYVFQARTLAAGRLTVPAPPLPEFFEHEFVLVREGAWFGKYPPGFPLVLALGVLAGAPWLVDVVLGGLGVLAVYVLGRRLYGPRVGLLGAALAATSPFLLVMSGSLMSHPWSLLLLTAFMILLPRAEDSAGGKGRAALLGAGACLGLALATRQVTALAVAAPWLAVAGYRLARGDHGSWRSVLPLAAGAAPWLAALLVYNWALSGDPISGPQALTGPWDRFGFGPEMGVTGGHTPAEGIVNGWRNLAELQPILYGWPRYLTLAPLLSLFGLGRARRTDWLLAATAGCLALAYVGFWAQGIIFGPRYWYEALPAFALLTARGCQELAWLAGAAARRVGRYLGETKLAAGSGRLAVGVLLGLLWLGNLAGYLPSALPAYRGYNGLGAGGREAVEAAGLRHALVFVQTRGHWYDYGRVFSDNSPLLDGEVIYARDLKDRNRELMALFPDRVPYLLNGTTLVPLAR